MLWSAEARRKHAEANNPAQHIRARVQSGTVHYNCGVITIPLRCANELAKHVDILNVCVEFAPSTHPNWRLHARTGALGTLAPAHEFREKITFTCPSCWTGEFEALGWSHEGNGIPGIVKTAVILSVGKSDKSIRIDLPDIRVNVLKSEQFQWLKENWQS